MRVCVHACLIYTASKAHKPYYVYRHFWPVRLYHNFPLYVTNGTILRKKKVIEKKMCVFDILYNFCLKNFQF